MLIYCALSMLPASAARGGGGGAPNLQPPDEEVVPELHQRRITML